MFLKGSRYENAKQLLVGDEKQALFAGIRPRSIGPAAGVLEHTLRSGDRLDLLAQHYYNDPRQWWRILDANPDFSYAGDLACEAMEGRVILIPSAEVTLEEE